MRLGFSKCDEDLIMNKRSISGDAMLYVKENSRSIFSGIRRRSKTPHERD